MGSDLSSVSHTAKTANGPTHASVLAEDGVASRDSADVTRYRTLASAPR